MLIREWWRFSRNETNGILLFLLCMLMAGYFPHWYKWHWNKPVKVHTERFATISKQIPLFHFDANHIAADSLIRAGIDAQLVHNWQRYLEKGGRFRRRQDLLKLWGMTDSIYQQLEPWVYVEEAGQKVPVRTAQKSTPVYTKQVHTPVDLNMADTAALERLRGIGKILSKRIVKYRQKLGGFVRVQQLKEVYGLSDSSFQVIEPVVFIAKDYVPEKINILSATYKDLISHPYIDNNMARLIVNFSRSCEEDCSIDRLEALVRMDSADFQKVRPYLYAAKEIHSEEY